MVKFLALLKLNFRAALAALRMGGRKRSVSGVGALVLLAGLSLYISGLYSFLFASQLAPAGALPLASQGRPADVEEERRLFYVGLTRAKEELVLTTAGDPSPFLAELPDTVVPSAVPLRERAAEQISLF